MKRPCRTDVDSVTNKPFSNVSNDTAKAYANILTSYLTVMCRSVEIDEDIGLTEDEETVYATLTDALRRRAEDDIKTAIFQATKTLFLRYDGDDTSFQPCYVATAVICVDTRGAVGPTRVFSRYGAAMMFCARLCLLEDMLNVAHAEGLTALRYSH